MLRGALATAVVGALAGCTARDTAPGAAPTPAGPGRSPAATPVPSASPSTEPSRPAAAPPAEPETVVATAVVDRLAVFAEPADPDLPAEPGEPALVLDRTERVTGQLVLLALTRGTAWTQVQLPVRPNGSTGWVRARDVSLSGHSYRIDVSLGGHEIVVTDAGREVLRSPVGVGRTDRPTPGGDYFVTELLRPPDPGGVYGPYAYGLSGYSDVLLDFNGGEGVIGIHGTDEPDRVGTDVSSGCIRLPNEEIVRLVEVVGLPLGTPVTIRA